MITGKRCLYHGCATSARSGTLYCSLHDGVLKKTSGPAAIDPASLFVSQQVHAHTHGMHRHMCMCVYLLRREERTRLVGGRVTGLLEDAVVQRAVERARAGGGRATVVEAALACDHMESVRALACRPHGTSTQSRVIRMESARNLACHRHGISTQSHVTREGVRVSGGGGNACLRHGRAQVGACDGLGQGRGMRLA